MKAQRNPGDLYFNERLSQYYLCVLTLDNQIQVILTHASNLRKSLDRLPELTFNYNMPITAYDPLKNEDTKLVGRVNKDLTAILNEEPITVKLNDHFPEHFKLE